MDFSECLIGIVKNEYMRLPKKPQLCRTLVEVEQSVQIMIFIRPLGLLIESRDAMQTLNDIKSFVESGNKKVATHFRVDVDNLMSVFFYAHLIGCSYTDLNLQFVQTDSPTIPEGYVGLDLRLAGFKGKETCCFNEMVKALSDEETLLALRSLSEYATMQDKGDYYCLPKVVQRGSLADQVAGLRGNRWRDGQLLKHFEPVFNAHFVCTEPDYQMGADVLDTLAAEWVRFHFQLSDEEEVSSSKFAALVKRIPGDDGLALKDFASYLQLEVSGEMNSQPAAVRAGLLATFVALLKANGWEDSELYYWLVPIFDAQLSKGHYRLTAETATLDCTKLANGRIVVLDVAKADTTAAFDLGADFAIYIGRSGMGIVRKAQLKEPHLGELVEPLKALILQGFIEVSGEETAAKLGEQWVNKIMEGFYIDDDGYLFAWGTRKAPATGPCPVTAMQLGKLLEELISQ